VSYHGLTVSHIDSWCHFFENGQMYNGTPVADNITPETGCKKGGVMNWKDGILHASRAVRHRAAEGRRVGRARHTITRAISRPGKKRSGVKAVQATWCCCTPAVGRGA